MCASILSQSEASAVLSGETLNTSPTAVVEIRQPDRDLQTPIKSPTAAVEFIRQPDDDQTPTLVTAETRSLSAHGVATSLPSGSTPAGDDAALGGLNVSNVQNFMSQPSNPNEPASSFAPESCQAALAHTTKPASGRADFFRSVCDSLPFNAATPPFTAMELLDLHPTIALGNPDFPVMTCTIHWRQTAATDRFAAYLDAQPKRTRRSRSNKQARNVARAFFARQTLVALQGVITAGARLGLRHPCDAPNLAYADLLELRYLAEDVLLHRDTDTRRAQSGFEQLSLFAQNTTSPYSPAFDDCRCRYDVPCDWKAASDRTFGVVRVPTATDSAREDASVATPTQAPPWL